MSTPIGSIYVALDVDIGRISRFRDAATTVVRDSARMRGALSGTSTSVSTLRNQMNQNIRARMFGDSLRTITRTNDEIQRLRASLVALSAITGTGLTGALSAAYLLQTADRARLLGNQLRTVTKDSADLVAVQGQLYDLSQRTRSSFQATTTIYARTARAAESLGVSQENLLRVTETVQKAFAVGGATQAEAQGAAIQLSQGIASDRFSGEEFRSVAENAPVLLQGMAKSLGVNIGKLREMAHAGELTGKVVVDAILRASSQIDVAFSQTTQTVGQSITQLDNAFLMYIGNADESYGITRKLSSAISGLADNFEEIAKWAAIAGGLGLSALGGRAISSRINASREFRKAQRDEIIALQEKFRVLKDEETLNRNAIATQQQKAAVAFQATQVVGASHKQILSGQRAQARAFDEVNKLRAIGDDIAVRQIETTQRLDGAQKAATRSARMMATAQRAGSGILGFFGGWTGIAFTAAIAGLAMWQANAAEAAEKTDLFTKKLRDLGYIASETSGDLESLADKLAKGRFAELQKDLQTSTVELGKWRDALNDVDLSSTFESVDLGAELGTASMPSSLTNRIEFLRKQFLEGKIGAAEFTRSINDLANTDSRVMDIARAFQDLAEKISGALEFQTDLNSALEAPEVPEWLKETVREYEQLTKLQKDAAAGNQFMAERTRLATMSPVEREAEDRARDIVKSAEQEGVHVGFQAALNQARTELTQERARKGLRDLVGYAEGTDKGRGYNETLDYGRWTGGDVNLTSMTLREVMALQQRMRTPENRRLYGNGKGSSAVGRYQITGQTLQSLVSELGLDPDTTRFSSDVQDRLADQLIRRRGRDAGGLKNEWEGLRRVPDSMVLEAFDASSTGMPAVDEGVQRWVDGIRDLDLQSKVAGLDEFNQRVAQQAQSMGATTEEIKKYADAIRSGDLEAVPERILAIQESMQNGIDSVVLRGLQDLSRSNAVKLLSDIDQEVIEIARSMGVAEPIIRQYVQALTDGKLTEVPEVMGRIRNEVTQTVENERFIEFTDGLADSIGGLVRDFVNGENALENFLKRLADLALEVLVIQPLVESLKESFRGIGTSGGGGGGGIFGSIIKGIGGLFGGGGGGLSMFPVGGGLWDEGGYTGGGSRKGVAGLVHNEEFVVRASQVAKPGVRQILEAINSGHVNSLTRGFADGGFVSSNLGPYPIEDWSNDAMEKRLQIDVFVNQDGNWEATVGSIAEKKAAPMVKAGMKQANKSVVPTITRYQQEVSGSDYRTM